MPNTIAERVRKWNQDISLKPVGEDSFLMIQSRIEYLTTKLFNQYVITKVPPYLGFDYRLRDWLDSAATDQDQRILLELVPNLFFVGEEESLSLCRSAFNGPIIRWLVDCAGVSLADTNIIQILSDYKDSTWFCPITDSMNINQFHHINRIKNQDYQPDFRSQTRINDPARLLTFMNQEKLERIILLEDFIGTGSQASNAIKFAASLSPNINVLVCPLIISQSGDKLLRKLQKKVTNIRYEPVLVLDGSVILSEKEQKDDKPFARALRNTVKDTHSLVYRNNNIHNYGAFGFGSNVEGGGLLVILFSNCPDNTIPLLHHTSPGTWAPLFPRSSRI
jgi:hypothetical protein